MVVGVADMGVAEMDVSAVDVAGVGVACACAPSGGGSDRRDSPDVT